MNQEHADEIVERIKYLIRQLNMRQIEFSKKIDVDPSNLSKYLNRRLPISDALLNRIVVNLGVSKTWLKDGTDLPFAKNNNIPAMTVIGPEALHLGSPVQGTPVYDVDVTAGMLTRDRMFANDLIVGSINLPDQISSDCRIVRVSGDSMSPVIQNGDYIAVRELNNIQQIFWGQIYVVLLDDFRLVKYVRKHEDPSKLILRSENKAYDDMEVSRDEIREMMYVQHIIHVDTRN